MRRYQERSPIYVLLNSRPARIAYTIILLMLIVRVAGMGLEMAALRDRLQGEQESLEEDRKNVEKLRALITRLEQGEDIEKDVRTGFNIKKPGEYTVVVVDEKKDDAEEEKPGLFNQLRTWMGF